LTQAGLAEKLGVQQSRISRIEHEANPRHDTVQSYARALGLEVVLVPRKQLGRVRAVLSNQNTPEDDDRSRFPSLADLIRDASDRPKKP
jgi:transcriptional regulator with XRE-family HTH domain